MFDVKNRLHLGYVWFSTGALVVVHVHYDWYVGVSFVKFLRARDKNFEGSECSLRGLEAKRMLRKVKHEAWASLGKTHGVLGKTQSRALLGKTQACLLGKTRYARGKT